MQRSLPLLQKIRKISIRYKLFISFLLFALLIFPISLFNLVNTNEIKNTVFDIVDHSLPSIRALLEMKNNANHVQAIVDSIQLNKDISQQIIIKKKDELLASLEEMDAWAKEYQENALGSKAIDLKTFSRLRDAVILSALNTFSLRVKSQSQTEIKLSDDQLKEALNKVYLLIENAVLSESLNLENTKEAINKRINQLYQTTIFSNIIILILVFALSMLLSRIISAPLIKLKNFATNISFDNLDQRTTIQTFDEIGELAKSINIMLDKLTEARNELIDVSRKAGKSEVATSILHNVGNVLNSVIISAAMIKEKNTTKDLEKFTKILQLLNENLNDIGNYLTNHPKGKLIIPYLSQLSIYFSNEKENISSEVNNVIKKLEEIKNIIEMQQAFIRSTSIKQTFDLSALVEETLSMFAQKINEININIEKDFSGDSKLTTDKNKLKQIIVNLFKNALEAVELSNQVEKKVFVKIEIKNSECIVLTIRDNGIGMDPENLTKIFSFGFTTKIGGHGFGLHNSALLAKELGGSLKADSEGINKGSSFILEIKKELTS